MSVKVADRTEGKMQYIQTARELLKYTLQRSLKFPKRYKLQEVLWKRNLD